MPKNMQQLIKFYETLNHSRTLTLLLNKLASQVKADGSIELTFANKVNIVFKDNALKVSQAANRNPDPDAGSFSWMVTFTKEDINLICEEWNHGHTKGDYINTYSFVIKNGEIIKANHLHECRGYFENSHKNNYPIGVIKQEEMLEKLEGLIISSTPLVAEAMEDYEFKVNATPVVHNFFKSVKTDLSLTPEKHNFIESTTEDVENIILNYLA